MAVKDFFCENCGATFELKSKQGKIGTRLSDGAYATMIARITGNENPDLFALQYSPSLEVTDLILTPRFFFTPQIIEKRPPLKETARRAGWVGCNILWKDIPIQGRIPIITKQHFSKATDVVKQYARVKKLQTKNLEARGWLLDVLTCVNSINKNEFSLSDVYAYADELRAKHTMNHHIEDKIRQQLQHLRDKGIIEFLGRGSYRKCN